MAHHAPSSPGSTDLSPFHSARLLGNAEMHGRVSRILLVIFLVGVAALFLPWQQNVQASGYVTALRPQDRPQTVPTVIAGRIERWHVAEGEYVRKGTPIVEISEVKDAYLDPNTLERYGEQVEGKEAAIVAKQAKVAALGRQIAALEQAREFSIQKGRNKVEPYEAAVRAAEMDSSIAGRQLARNRTLYEEGLKSRTELETFEIRAQATDARLVEKRQELENARIELDAFVADYAEKIAKAMSEQSATRAEIGEGRADVAKLKNQYAAMAVRNDMYRITAPQDGFVVRAVRAGIGEQLKEGDPVVTVMPNDPQQAVELYVKPMDVPLLRPGRKVRLQFDGWPALQFSGWPSVAVGTFGGIIRVVDLTNSADGSYRILVVPDPEDEPWPAQVRVGSGVLGWAMLDEVRVWFEIWRKFNGFPPTTNPNDPEAAGAVAKEK